jgi:hypothetical protein
MHEYGAQTRTNANKHPTRAGSHGGGVQVTTGDGWYDMMYDAAVAPPFCTKEVVPSTEPASPVCLAAQAAATREQ